MTTLRRLAAALLAVVAVASTCGFGPEPRQSWTGRLPQEEEFLRKLLGVLTYTPVTIHFDRTPAREAFDALRGALDISLIGRYRDDSFGYGLDPEVPITLDAADRPALEVLEAMLEQCSRVGEACTWQMRKGYIEFGTKERLSVPAARDTRTYYVADLNVDIPENPIDRTRREVHAMDVVQEICETVEPGEWDYGQELEPAEQEDFVPSPKADTDRKSAGQGTAPPPRRPSTQGRHVPPVKVAIIRYWRDVVIIHAPDFFHRQIKGYPEPIRPGDRP
jgi:hypothetical protein